MQEGAVRRDEDRACLQSVGGDQHVEGLERSAGAAHGRAEIAIDNRSFLRPGQYLDFLKKIGKRGSERP